MKVHNKNVKANLLSQVRSTCRKVSKDAYYVRINEEIIQNYINSLPIKEFQEAELDPNIHFLNHAKDTLSYIVTLDAINFGSGYFPYLKMPANISSGYYTIALSLTNYYKEHSPLSAEDLENIDTGQCARIFGQELNNTPVTELMYLYANALNSLGTYLNQKFEGSFARLIESAESSAEKLIRLLIEMPYFNDVSLYRNLAVPFFKRAQIMVADLCLAFKGKGFGYFIDIDDLTIFADNVVPHVLRIDKILQYREVLEKRINSGSLISTGSVEEVEIRACAIHASELIVQQLRKIGININAMHLDYILWNKGQNDYYRRILPRHKTKTIFY